jgi:hypothetical protein
MPKLTEESTQRFTPITKPSSDNTSTITNLITPVPIHGNSTPTINKTQSEFNSNNGIYQFLSKYNFHFFVFLLRNGNEFEWNVSIW